MDLKLNQTPPSEAERRAVDRVLGEAGSEDTVPAAEAKRRRTQLLPALRALQSTVGWVSVAQTPATTAAWKSE